MKVALAVLMICSLVSVAFAGDTPAATASSPAFEKLKSLVGTWSGKDEDGNPVTVIYTLVSSGTSLMESMTANGHTDNMITMYHPDGKSIMLTHYCSMGNQPRMRARGLSKDGSKLEFGYVDATNLAKPKADHMHALSVTFKDENHFSQDWTMMQDGKAAHHGLFEYERVKN